jgi:hypothetical protein
VAESATAYSCLPAVVDRRVSKHSVLSNAA